MPITRIGNVFYRVDDMDAAVRFYSEVLGFPLKLRDGERWAAFDVGGATLAVEGRAPGGERGVPGSDGGAPGGQGGGPGGEGGQRGATVSLRCEGLDGVVAALRAKGATVSDVETGPHERRAELRDPAGNLLVLYEPVSR